MVKESNPVHAFMGSNPSTYPPGSERKKEGSYPQTIKNSGVAPKYMHDATRCSAVYCVQTERLQTVAGFLSAALALLPRVVYLTFSPGTLLVVRDRGLNFL